MIDDITSRRVEKALYSTDLSPLDMFRKLVHDIETGEFDPRHVIVAWRDEDHHYGYLQAGPDRRIEAVGLLDCVKQLVWHDCEV